MFARILDEIGNIVREAAVNACWRQWTVLGSSAAPISERPEQSIVDPEALLLLSCSVQAFERRLTDFIAWWASAGAELTSVQRLNTLVQRFPTSTHAPTRHFAYLAAEAGDRRWLRHALEPNDELKPRPGKGSRNVNLAHPATLMLRFRAGFGVGAKADLLSFLVGTRGAIVSTKLAATATCYTTTTIRSVAKDMVRARLIEETAARPVGYFARWQAWADLLRIVQPERSSLPDQAAPVGSPQWRYWAQLFVFLADVEDWVSQSIRSGHGEYVVASKARDLYDEYSDTLKLNGIDVPSPTTHKGKAFIPAFKETVEQVADWIERNL